jgi:uncharacterized membrane protein
MRINWPLLWSILLLLLLGSLTIWGSFFVHEIQHKISVFGIVAVITAAFTSVITVSINHKKTKEREYELMLLKEKQKVYEHFYNVFFELLNNTKKGKSGISKKAQDEMMLFKRGLMNWGSEKLIKSYLEYESKLDSKDSQLGILENGNKFLKDLRKEMGFHDSKDLNLMSIILTAEARKELKDLK